MKKRTPNKHSHRPIMIQNIDGPYIDASIIEAIKNVAVKICVEYSRSRKILDALVMEYRELVGYNETKLTFEEQTEEMFPIDTPESWIEFAEDERKRWVMESAKEALGIKD